LVAQVLILVSIVQNKAMLFLVAAHLCKKKSGESNAMIPMLHLNLIKVVETNKVVGVVIRTVVEVVALLAVPLLLKTLVVMGISISIQKLQLEFMHRPVVNRIIYLVVVQVKIKVKEAESRSIEVVG